MVKRSPFSGLALIAALICGGCASIPGKTGSEQRQSIDALLEKTLADLYQQHPEAQSKVNQSVGYTVMSNKITKIPGIGVGAGYGAAVESSSGARTYLRMRRFDIGAGWGARGVRSILVFHSDQAFRQFIDGDLDAKLGAEAAAKVGETGAAGAGAAQAPGQDRGYSSYLLTDAGVSATVTFGIIRVKPIRLKGN